MGFQRLTSDPWSIYNQHNPTLRQKKEPTLQLWPNNWVYYPHRWMFVSFYETEKAIRESKWLQRDFLKKTSTGEVKSSTNIPVLFQLIFCLLLWLLLRQFLLFSVLLSFLCVRTTRPFWQRNAWENDAETALRPPVFYINNQQGGMKRGGYRNTGRRGANRQLNTHQYLLLSWKNTITQSREE